MNIQTISDTHTYHNRFQFPKIPECDVLIHAGDATFHGTDVELKDFIDWLSIQPAQYKVFTPGNHDIGFEVEPIKSKMLQYAKQKNVIVLIDSSVTIDNKKIYGTPYTPYFFGWGFQGIDVGRDPEYFGGPEYIKKKYPQQINQLMANNVPLLCDIYAKIPDDTNILICHGPPAYSTMDKIPVKSRNRAGSMSLLNRIDQLDSLELGVFGHLHGGYGKYTYINSKNITSILVNAAILDDEYTFYENRKPIEVEIY